MSDIQAVFGIAPAVRYQQEPKRNYFDVALGSDLPPTMGSVSVDQVQP